MRTILMLCVASLIPLGAALSGCGGADDSVTAPGGAAIANAVDEVPEAKIETGQSAVTDVTTLPEATKDAGDALAQADDALASMGDTLAKAPAQEDPLAAPADVKKAPDDAQVTASGLKSKVLKAGWGSRHPGATDTVTVHYTGWTRNGKRFDSSVARGEPSSFPLNAVIDGWTEGVQLMVEGEKRRFWIPGDLAYGMTPKRPGAPAGDLVFDIELLEIK